MRPVMVPFSQNQYNNNNKQFKQSSNFIHVCAHPINTWPAFTHHLADERFVDSWGCAACTMPPCYQAASLLLLPPTTPWHLKISHIVHTKQRHSPGKYAQIFDEPTLGLVADPRKYVRRSAAQNFGEFLSRKMCPNPPNITGASKLTQTGCGAACPAQPGRADPRLGSVSEGPRTAGGEAAPPPSTKNSHLPSWLPMSARCTR